MLRRQSLNFGIALVVGLSLSLPAFALDERPNILFAFADDWGRHASIYAEIEGPGSPDDVVRTPHFDKFAREGVLFRNAFVSAPSCTPCRSALLSGQHFWRTGRGAILQGAVWDDSIPSYPLLLKDAGYHIGETYKVWSPGTPVDAPYGAPEHSYESAGRRFNQFSQNVQRMVEQGRAVEEAKQVLYDEVLANFDAFLDDRAEGQPFCYWFGPTNVHRKWIKGSGKDLWDIDPDDLEGKMPPFLPDVPEVRQDLADYFGEVLAFDTVFGLLLAKLEEMGELDNTLIVVSGDHGPPGFPQGKCNLYDYGARVPLAIRWGSAQGGRVVDDPVSLTDLAPTFLEAGEVDRPEVMTGRSLVNVLQSAQSGFVDQERQAIFTGRERHVGTAREDNLPYPQRAIRTREHLYIINFEPDRWPMGDPLHLDADELPDREGLTENTFVTFKDMDAGPTKAWLFENRDDPDGKWHYELAFGKRPREELFLLADDPHQVNNVAADPNYADLRADLHRKLLEELRRTGDPRVIDDGEYFETPPLAGPLP